ncbi:MAG: pro-sigmaK processing inhibitor BofA family protein [Oscillospiraceae bacterium]|nr:pro-sigmaK processing inhibitor BofA family protein [Oscillospiraceae bacterium]
MFAYVILFGAALAAIALLFWLITLPIRPLFKLLINLAAGYMMLFLFNLFSCLTGFSLDLNLVSAAIIGLLGLPGLALLLIVRFLLL